MNKFLVMIILKPDIKENRINTVQSSILNLFEQSTKVKKVWYLGRKKLDFKNKRNIFKTWYFRTFKKNWTDKKWVKKKSRYFIFCHYE